MEAVSASPGDYYISDEPIPLDWLDSIIWEDIKAFVENPGDVIQQLQEHMREDNVPLEQPDEIRRELEKAIAAKKSEKDRMLDAYRRGLIDIEELERHINSSNQELDLLYAGLTDVSQQSEHAGHTEELLTDAESILLELQNKVNGPLSFDTKRSVVDALVDGITVETSGEGRHKEATVTVTYTFSNPTADALENSTSGHVE